jgi:hypothetical protein
MRGAWTGLPLRFVAVLLDAVIVFVPAGIVVGHLDAIRERLAGLPSIPVIAFGDFVRRTPVSCACEQDAHRQVNDWLSATIERMPELIRLVFRHERSMRTRASRVSAYTHPTSLGHRLPGRHAGCGAVHRHRPGRISATSIVNS